MSFASMFPRIYTCITLSPHISQSPYFITLYDSHLTFLHHLPSSMILRIYSPSFPSYSPSLLPPPPQSSTCTKYGALSCSKPTASAPCIENCYTFAAPTCGSTKSSLSDAMCVLSAGAEGVCVEGFCNSLSYGWVAEDKQCNCPADGFILRTRAVFCVSSDNRIVSKSYCDPTTMPSTIMDCCGGSTAFDIMKYLRYIIIGAGVVIFAICVLIYAIRRHWCFWQVQPSTRVAAIEMTSMNAANTDGPPGTARVSNAHVITTVQPVQPAVMYMITPAPASGPYQNTGLPSNPPPGNSPGIMVQSGYSAPQQQYMPSYTPYASQPPNNVPYSNQSISSAPPPQYQPAPQPQYPQAPPEIPVRQGILNRNLYHSQASPPRASVAQQQIEQRGAAPSGQYNYSTQQPSSQKGFGNEEAPPAYQEVMESSPMSPYASAPGADSLGMGSNYR